MLLLDSPARTVRSRPAQPLRRFNLSRFSGGTGSKTRAPPEARHLDFSWPSAYPFGRSKNKCFWSTHSISLNHFVVLQYPF